MKETVRFQARRALVVGALVLLLPAVGPAQAEDFGIVLLPDTQYYDKYYSGTVYRDQTAWIVDHKDDPDKNIRFVIHLGDITDDNHVDQWTNAWQAHETLANGAVRFSIVPGNHDMPEGHGGPLGTGDRYWKRISETDNFNVYFGPDAFDCFMHGPDCAHSNAYGGPIKPGHNENNWQTFEAGGARFLVVNLQFAPTKDALCWAEEVIDQNQDRHVIVVTHGYTGEADLQPWGESCPRIAADRVTNANNTYRLIGGGGNEVFDELVRKHNNVAMVLSGHVGDSEHRVRVGSTPGHIVHEILTDYQFDDPNPPEPPPPENCDWSYSGTHAHGGNGWIRLLRFSPADNRVYATIKTTLDPFDPDPDSDYNEAFPCIERLNHREHYDSDPTHPSHQFDFSFHLATVPVHNHPDPSEAAWFADRTVNQQGAGDQRYSAVAMDAAGNFVVVWTDYHDDLVKMRGFGPTGCESFPETVVYPFPVPAPTSRQRAPAIAMAAHGDFVVVWEDDSDGNGHTNAYLRGFPAGFWSGAL